jgi:hypothetical protein
MKVRTLERTAWPHGDTTIEEDPELFPGDDVQAVHGVQLELPSVTLNIRQIRGASGWTFVVHASTPHAESEPNPGRIYSSTAFDEQHGSAETAIWAGFAKP